MNPWGEILVLDSPIAKPELQRLVSEQYGSMVKFVVDIERERIAIGGELHADAEAVLLEVGSRQQDLWGGNCVPGRGPDRCIVRGRVRELVHRLIGRGEETE